VFPAVSRCELEEGHEGQHKVIRHFVRIADVTDKSIKIFRPQTIDRTEILWDNEEDDRIMGNLGAEVG